MATTSETPSAVPQINKHPLLFFTIGISILTLLLILVVAFHAVSFGAPSVWVWEYQPLTVPSRILFGLIPLTAILAVIFGPGRALLQSEAPTRKQECGALVALWLAVFVSANAIVLMHPSGWAYPATLIVNPASNSYFSTALKHPDLSTMLNDYPDKMSGFISHAQTQTAGPVVFSGLAARLAKASPATPFIADTLFALSPGLNPDDVAQFCKRWDPHISTNDVRAALCVGLLMIAIGGLTVIPLYLLGKWLSSPAAGFFAALSFIVLPAFSLFSVSVDQMYPLVTAVGLCGVWRGMQLMESKSPWALLWLGLTGIWLGIGIFFNVGLIVAIAFCGLFAAFMGYTLHCSIQRILPGTILFISGILLVPLSLYIFYGYNLWVVYLTSNHLFNTLYYNSRSYFASLWASPLDFFLFCGLPVVLLWIWYIRQIARQRQRTAAIAFSAAFIITLLFLSVTGRVRGESARMLMFLSPPILVGAGVILANVWRKSRPAAIYLLGLQLAQLIVFQYFIRVWGY
jgi:hypothetical protein